MASVIRRFPELVAFAGDELRYRLIFRKYREFTMIPGHSYVGNLHLAARVRNVPGCIVECGTWRGGMIAGIADVLGRSRHYYLFDSFEGLPPAREIDGQAALAWQSDTTGSAYYNNCTASEDDARRAMSRSRARNYQIVKGWFEATLPGMKWIEPIALLRMDADWYESTRCILENLASRLAPGGLILVDDYYTWDGCAQAVNEFAVERKWKIRQSRIHGVCYIAV